MPLSYLPASLCDAMQAVVASSCSDGFFFALHPVSSLEALQGNHGLVFFDIRVSILSLSEFG